EHLASQPALRIDFTERSRAREDIRLTSCLGGNYSWPGQRPKQKAGGDRRCPRSVAVEALGEQGESADVRSSSGYRHRAVRFRSRQARLSRRTFQDECLSASRMCPDFEVQRKRRAIDLVTNFLARSIAFSNERPHARPAVIAAEYVQPV